MCREKDLIAVTMLLDVTCMAKNAKSFLNCLREIDVAWISLSSKEESENSFFLLLLSYRIPKDDKSQKV